MKIDYELSQRLGEAAFRGLIKQLNIESDNKPFKADGNQLVGMFLTSVLVLVELVSQAIESDVKNATQSMVVKDLIAGLNYSFLREKDVLH